MPNQSAFATFRCQGSTVSVEALMIHIVSNEVIPSHTDTTAFSSHRAFLTQRAEQILGKWPVHVFYPETTESDTEGRPRFSGVRVFVRCSTFPSDGVDLIEMLNVVWHQETASFSIPGSILSLLETIPWSSVAVKVDF